MKATIHERGNGMPDPGDYVVDDSNNLYRVVSTGRIHASRRPGESATMQCSVEPADWDDIPSQQSRALEPVATVVIEEGE